MSGFSNPIIGGGGALVYPSIHSPGFSIGPPVTGWSIDKDGNAYLGDVTISGTFSGNYFELNSAGFFLYSSTPALGNLIFSAASAGGSDSFGNVYKAGSWAYGTSGVIGAAATSGALAELVNGELSLTDSSGNTSAVLAGLLGGTAYLQLYRGSATPVLIDASGHVIGIEPGAAGTPEAWHNMALATGFAALAGFAAPRYRYEPIGSGGQVRLDGALSLTANHAVGTAFTTMPAHYQPSFSKYFLQANSLSGGVGTQVESLRVINATGGGFLELGSNGSSGNYLLLEDVVYPLD